MIEKKDFITLEYTGKTDDDQVFDTTDEKIAADAGIKQDGATYGPATICVGEGHLLKGLEDNIIGKEEGKDYSITIEPENAFGKKNAKLVQLIPTGKFKQHNIVPQVGLQVDIDGMNGIIKTVSGGRTLVDFNHPLSGKNVNYSYKILKKVTEDKDKLAGFLKLMLGMKSPDIVINEGKAIVKIEGELPKEILDEVGKKASELIPNIKDVKFEKKKEEIKKNSKESNQLKPESGKSENDSTRK